jgi:hypothetical protein
MLGTENRAWWYKGNILGLLAFRKNCHLLRATEDDIKVGSLCVTDIIVTTGMLLVNTAFESL